MTNVESWALLALIFVILWLAVSEGGRRVDDVLDRFHAARPMTWDGADSAPEGGPELRLMVVSCLCGDPECERVETDCCDAQPMCQTTLAADQWDDTYRVCLAGYGCHVPTPDEGWVTEDEWAALTRAIEDDEKEAEDHR